MERRGVMYIIGVIFLLPAVASGLPDTIIAAEISDEHNIYMCPYPSEDNGDRFDGIIHGNPGIAPITRIFKYPDMHIKDKKITCIQVIDLDPSDKGGYPKIINGGVGSNSVTIQIKSRWFYGYNFRILILFEK